MMFHQDNYRDNYNDSQYPPPFQNYNCSEPVQQQQQDWEPQNTSIFPSSVYQQLERQTFEFQEDPDDDPLQPRPLICHDSSHSSYSSTSMWQPVDHDPLLVGNQVQLEMPRTHLQQPVSLPYPSYQHDATTGYWNPSLPRDNTPPFRSPQSRVKRSVMIEHQYHDRLKEHLLQQQQEHESLQHQSFKTSLPPNLLSSSGRASSFPLKLHVLLAQIQEDGWGHVMGWQPHGRAFCIRKPQEFKTHLLGKYFQSDKASSFQRQLSLYGFKRLTQGQDRHGYYHEYFLQGYPHLSRHISRRRIKGTGVRGKSNPDDEPCFWDGSIPSVKELEQEIKVPKVNDEEKEEESPETREAIQRESLPKKASQSSIHESSVIEPLPMNDPLPMNEPASEKSRIFYSAKDSSLSSSMALSSLLRNKTTLRHSPVLPRLLSSSSDEELFSDEMLRSVLWSDSDE